MQTMGKETAGYIYIMTNPSFPAFVKIGYADDLDRRLKDLNRSECVPYAFHLYASYAVQNRLDDKKIHSMLDRINPGLRCVDTFDGKTRKKEFYSLSREDAYKIFETIARVSGTEENLKLYEQTEEELMSEDDAELTQMKRGITKLPRMDWLVENGVVNAGDEIFIIGHPEEKATVIDSGTVNYNGKVMSFNQFGCKVTGWKTIQIYAWAQQTGSDKTLAELRKEKMRELGMLKN